MVNKEIALEFASTYFSHLFGSLIKSKQYFWSTNIQGNDMLVFICSKKREEEEERYIHFNPDSVIYEAPDYGLKLEVTEDFETFKANYEKNLNKGI